MKRILLIAVITVSSTVRAQSEPCLDTASFRDTCDDAACLEKDLKCAKTCDLCRDSEYIQHLFSVPENQTCNRKDLALLGCNHFCEKDAPFKQARCSCKPGYELFNNKICLSEEDKKILSSRKTCIGDTYKDACTPCTPSSNTCGKVPASRSGNLTDFGRIVNGEDSSEEDFPWIAQINKNCGGTFIADNYIVTAFHCIYTYLDPTTWMNIEVFAGVDQWSSTSGGFTPLTSKPFAKHPQKYRVIEVKVPPGVKTEINPVTKQAVDYELNDIAILKVEKIDVQANRWDPVPICLPEGEIPEVGRNCFVIGYGQGSYHGPPTNRLMEAKVPIIDDGVCEKKYKDFPSTDLIEQFSGDVQICAGHNDGLQDSCRGDSGGPLMCQRANSCEWYLAGVVSYGWKCGITYGVYAEVNAFAGWINDVTGLGPALKTPVTPEPTIRERIRKFLREWLLINWFRNLFS